MHVAFKTMQAIETAMELDGGNVYRQHLKSVLPHITDAYRSDDAPFRGHLGASVLGNECDRAIWYGFRWSTITKFPGRILRLFNRGHLEEGRLIAALLTIGAQIYQQDAQGKQFRISFADGHGGGSGDGVVTGIPDLPVGVYALLEFKTHNDKSFADLKKQGVKLSKYTHYVQMQLYMEKMGLQWALYVAVNKNTDEIYAELVSLHALTAQTYITRAEILVQQQTPPAKLNESPGFYKCKFCDHIGICHLGKVPERNCRTCINAKPVLNGQWVCALNNVILTSEMQLVGCDKHHRGF